MPCIVNVLPLPVCPYLHANNAKVLNHRHPIPNIDVMHVREYGGMAAVLEDEPDERLRSVQVHRLALDTLVERLQIAARHTAD